MDKPTFYQQEPDVHSEMFVQRGCIGKSIVEVSYVEFNGGGVCYEFYIAQPEDDGAVSVYKSDMEYGSPTPCLIDGYIFALTGSLAVGDDPDDWCQLGVMS